MQKVLTVGTATDSLRADVESWGDEDGDQLHFALRDHITKYTKFDIPVGLIRAGRFPSYPTVLHAIADGWKLLAPPTKHTFVNGDGKSVDTWDWWLVKD